MTETDIREEQSTDSFQASNGQSSEQVQIATLQSENKELKSRIGDLVRKAGEEKRTIEEQYAQWAANYKAWADNEISKKDKTIERLEEKFLEHGDAEGAKVVLEERRSREQEERSANAARQEAARLLHDEINSAIEQAVKTLDEVNEAEIRAENPQSSQQVWAAAARISRNKEAGRRAAEVVVPVVPVVEDTREQEENSRVPGESRGDGRPAATRRMDDTHARLKELEEELEKTKRSPRGHNNLARAAALRGEIIAIKKRMTSAS